MSLPTISDAPSPLSSLADLLDPPEADTRWEPQAKQRRAEELATEADELLYGGAAFGGKSYWLVQHVIDEMIMHPGNRGVIFRRVFPSLNRTIVPKVREFVRGFAIYNESLHEARFFNGSVLELATLQRVSDSQAYLGAEYGVVAFEELTEFVESQYTDLIGRLRAPVDGVRAHAISTTNPGGVGHKWVKRRFVKPTAVDIEEDVQPPKAYEVWRPRATDENSTPEYPPLSRAFVPATMDDNVIGMQRDPRYRVRLRANTSRGKRKAMEFGDWDAIDAVEGALWEQQWLDGYRVSSVRDSIVRAVSVDPSDGEEGGDAYGIAVVSKGLDGRGYVEQSMSWHKPINDLIDGTVELAKEVGADRIVVEKNHGGKWLIAAFKARHPDIRITEVWASDNKRTRAEPISVLFEPVDEALPRACIVGNLPELEGQMTTFTGAAGEPSPDELDAVVWGLTDVMGFRKRTGPRMSYPVRAAA